jgi:uncharacterized protein (TIGR02677 family)
MTRHSDLTSPAADAGNPPGAETFGAVTAISYATAPSAPVYRAIMRIFYLNRQEYGPHLSPADVAAQLRVRFGLDHDGDALAADLEQLRAWGSLDARQDTPRVRHASELVRKQFIYDITAVGEHCERFLELVENLHEQSGSLQSQRLPAVLTELRRLAARLDDPDPDPAELQAAFTNLVAALEELRQGAAEFMRDLARLMHATDALDEDAFATYKTQIFEYLTGFRSRLETDAPVIADAIAAVEARGVERMLDLIASIQEAPQYDISPAEARRRAVEPLRRGWNGVRGWFSPQHGQPHFKILDQKLYDAIGWILRAVQRLKERRSHRVDRSTEYRRLARLLFSAPDEDAHAIFHAAFGLHAPRHFGVPEDDEEDTSAQTSFWQAPVVSVAAHLRNPDRNAPGSGRGARILDSSLAQEALRQRREAERRELARALERFAEDPVLHLSQIGELDQVEFEHLLAWLGRALETGRQRGGGPRQAESVDGLVVITLHEPADLRPQVTLRTPVGTFHTPDYRLEIAPA